ncbi:unnamed protein product [Ectocarpus sp. 12 AP-2014]
MWSNQYPLGLTVARHAHHVAEERASGLQYCVDKNHSIGRGVSKVYVLFRSASQKWFQRGAEIYPRGPGELDIGGVSLSVSFGGGRPDYCCMYRFKWSREYLSGDSDDDMNAHRGT